MGKYIPKKRLSGAIVHRFTSDSKMGRRIAANVPVKEPTTLPQEILDWNARVEAKKVARHGR
jgi:hypothetical protein